MSIGPLEILIVVLIIVLIWRGPKILPQLGEATGKAVRSVRETIDRDSAGADGKSDAAEPGADGKRDAAEPGADGKSDTADPADERTSPRDG